MKAKELNEGKLKREIEAWQDREERRTGRRPDWQEFKFPKKYYLLINGRLWTKKSPETGKRTPVEFDSIDAARRARRTIEQKDYKTIAQIIDNQALQRHYASQFKLEESIINEASLIKDIYHWIHKLKGLYLDFQLKMGGVPIDYYRPVFNDIASELERSLRQDVILNPDDHILIRAAPMIKEIADRIRNAKSLHELNVIVNATEDFLEALEERADYERTHGRNKLEELDLGAGGGGSGGEDEEGSWINWPEQDWSVHPNGMVFVATDRGMQKFLNATKPGLGDGLMNEISHPSFNRMVEHNEKSAIAKVMEYVYDSLKDAPINFDIIEIGISEGQRFWHGYAKVL